MLLPILVSTAEAGLRALPDAYRFVSRCAGHVTRCNCVSCVIVTRRRAMHWLAGLLLGIGRAMAETAALLFTSGYVDRMPGSLLDSGRTLAVHIFRLYP